ncbi:unnamed protein product [Symbiodinium necroappetens]|uniref:Uncharacterized protein n=1 Tax=Symbiodinium necroappetens TaxID=1628268 RepID=A0A812U474_9DINO|nr:unnamed protein product [Symbiodinium necroappetens]
MQKAKGVPKDVRLRTKHAEYCRIHEANSVQFDRSVALRSQHHQVSLVETEKKTYQVLNDKAFQITREYARLLGHWRNAFVGLWVKIEQRMPIFEKILEFVRGPAPQMREEWGEPVRELIRLYGHTAKLYALCIPADKVPDRSVVLPETLHGVAACPDAKIGVVVQIMGGSLAA